MWRKVWSCSFHVHFKPFALLGSMSHWRIAYLPFYSIWHCRSKWVTSSIRNGLLLYAIRVTMLFWCSYQITSAFSVGPMCWLAWHFIPLANVLWPVRISTAGYDKWRAYIQHDRKKETLRVFRYPQVVSCCTKPETNFKLCFILNDQEQEKQHCLQQCQLCA